MYRNFKCNPILLRLLNKICRINIIKCNSSSEASIELPSFKLHNIEHGPPGCASISKEEGLKIYQQMSLIRRAENIAAQLYTAKIIRGFCHLYNGQEACAVGLKSAMRKKDKVITSYRAHAWTMVMGVSPVGVLAELMGRKTGCSRGKGGSMHMYGENFFGGNGIVGGQVPLGTGLGLSCKYKKQGDICVTLYGDGAANQGQVAESFNMAALWKLPILYVCENNKYGMGTSVERAAANPDLYTRGQVIPGIWVDGMDVLAVRAAAQFAIEHVLKEGPMILECSTYRYFGHSMSDPGISYRPREEVQTMREKHDPITGFKAKLIEAGLATEDEFKKIEEEVKNVIDAASKQAQEDKEIGLEELSADIYSKPIELLVRGPTGYTYKHMSVGKPINLK